MGKKSNLKVGKFFICILHASLNACEQILQPVSSQKDIWVCLLFVFKGKHLVAYSLQKEQFQYFLSLRCYHWTNNSMISVCWNICETKWARLVLTSTVRTLVWITSPQAPFVRSWVLAAIVVEVGVTDYRTILKAPICWKREQRNHLTLCQLSILQILEAEDTLMSRGIS